MKITVNKIKKNYSKRQVLKEISFEISFSCCVGILGINGSGKSTLLSILAGVQNADGGEFLYNGTDLLKDEKKRADIVGYVPQGTPLIEELTARDNLLLWFDKNSLKQELKTGVLSMLGISEFLNKKVSTLSGGMKKRLSIGCSMAGHPKILLLDEPSSAIDFVCKKNISDYIDAFKENGGAVVIATHDISELNWCDTVYLLKDGKMHHYDYDGNLERLVDHLK